MIATKANRAIPPNVRPRYNGCRVNSTRAALTLFVNCHPLSRMASPRPVVNNTTTNTTKRTATFEPAGISPPRDHDTNKRSIRPATNPPTNVQPNDFIRPTMAATKDRSSNLGPMAV